MSVCMYKSTNQYQPIVKLAAFLKPAARLRMSHDAFVEETKEYVYADIRDTALIRPFSGYLRDLQRIN